MRTIVLLCVLTLVGACGSSADDGPDEAAAEGTEVRTHSPAELGDALLTLDDLPRGWRAGEDDEEEASSDACATSTLGDDLESDAEANFEESDFGPFFSESLTQLEVAGAEEHLDDIRTGIEECTSWVETDEDGTETEVSLEEVDAPDLGDEAVAFEVTATTTLGAFVLDLCVVRVDGVVAWFAYGGFGGADEEELADLAAEGIAKLLALD